MCVKTTHKCVDTYEHTKMCSFNTFMFVSVDSTQRHKYSTDNDCIANVGIVNVIAHVRNCISHNVCSSVFLSTTLYSQTECFNCG